MTATTRRTEQFYTGKRVAAELRRYRKAGPIPSTRALIERATVIPVDAIERVVSANGLRLQTATTVGPWRVALYRRGGTVRSSTDTDAARANFKGG